MISVCKKTVSGDAGYCLNIDGSNGSAALTVDCVYILLPPVKKIQDGFVLNRGVIFHILLYNNSAL